MMVNDLLITNLWLAIRPMRGPPMALGARPHPGTSRTVPPITRPAPSTAHHDRSGAGCPIRPGGKGKTDFAGTGGLVRTHPLLQFCRTFRPLLYSQLSLSHRSCLTARRPGATVARRRTREPANATKHHNRVR